jgi:hypothetical protein
VPVFTAPRGARKVAKPRKDLFANYCAVFAFKFCWLANLNILFFERFSALLFSLELGSSCPLS